MTAREELHIFRVINSCKTLEQLNSCASWLRNLKMLHAEGAQRAVFLITISECTRKLESPQPCNLRFSEGYN